MNKDVTEYSVAIYSVDKGFQTWQWLCTKCAAQKRKEGAEVKKKGPLVLFDTCDSCSPGWSAG